MTNILGDLTPEQAQALLDDLKPQFWHRGDLTYKLHGTQKKIRNAVNASQDRQFFVACSRRLGKSYGLFVMAVEQCLQVPGSRVLYLAPEKNIAAEIATDIADKVFADCPEHLRPDYKAQDKAFFFRNGSIIRIKGVNGERASMLRGTEAHLIILDEAATMDHLEQIVQSVCLPMVLSTDGRIVFATTPPMTTGHDSYKVYRSLLEREATIKFTIRDAPHYSDERKAEFLYQAGERKEDCLDIVRGLKRPKTTTARREYFVEWISDGASRVVPEWTPEAVEEIVPVDHETFVDWGADFNGYEDCYVAMDPGFRDRTGILYGWYSWELGKIVIRREALLDQASTSDIAQEILDAEYELWPNQKPTLRVSDIDLRLIADLYERHGLVFNKAQKQDSLGAVNYLRTLVKNREIVIHPDCKRLIQQLEHTIWNTKATDFERDAEGHGDLLAAGKYFVRHINRRKMPSGYVPSRRPGDNLAYEARRRANIEDRKPSLMPKTSWGKKMTALSRRIGRK